MIPKLIHQLWIDHAIPERFVGFRDGWLRHHPGWTYRLWTDVDVVAFVRSAEPDLLPLFEGHDRAICRADIARYLILKHLGGLYVDLDFECLRPLDPLLVGARLAIGLEPGSHVATEAVRARGFDRILCPSLIVSEPRHAFWDAVVEDLGRRRGEADVLDATGPFLLTRAYARWVGEQGGGDIRLLPAAAVYPVDKFACWEGRLLDLAFWERATRDAYALHHWDGGWFRSDAHRSRALRVALTGPAGAHPPEADSGSAQGRASGRHAAPEERGGGPVPLVSCLMVTRGRAAQARLAVACFQAQTYPNRELVIVEDGEDTGLGEAVSTDPRIRYHRTGDPDPVLGRARNRAVALARGAYVCQWDDDDLYDPERLALQMAALTRSGARACLLARWTMWWPAQGRCAISRRRPWEGSLLSERSILSPYPDLPRGEDTVVVEALLSRHRVVHLDEPRLYLYVVHGRNTFAGPHFDGHWDAAEARFSGNRYAAVLNELGKRLPVAAYAATLRTEPPATSEPDWDAAVATAGRLLLADRPDEAQAAFERLRCRDPGHPAGLDGLARVSSRSGDWITAIDRWDEARAVFPDHVPGLLGRAQALLELGRLDEGRAAFRDVARRPGHGVEGAVGLAESWTRARDWRRALDAWREVRRARPASSRAIVGIVQALAELGDLAAAEAEMRAVTVLTDRDRLSAAAILLQKRHRDAELSELLAGHPDLVRSDPGLRALFFQVEEGYGRAREALRVLRTAGKGASKSADEAEIEALGAIYAPNAEPVGALAGLHALWLRHGLAVATPDLLALLVRAVEQQEGRSEALQLLDAVEKPNLDSALAIRLNLIAVFERLRLDPAARVSDALRHLAGRRDPRAPFGAWRDALYWIANAYTVIDRAFPDNRIDSAWREPSARGVVERILSAVRRGQPLSLIRLGDGEGNFLDYPTDQAWHAQADRDATQRIWWGEPRLRFTETVGLGRELQEAVRAADIVGVPDPARLCAGLPLPCPEDLYATGHDMRGLLVILDHLVRAGGPDRGAALFRPDQLITSCHIHADLAAYGLYEPLFAEIGSVAVLTCHEALADRLRDRFGLTVTRTIPIPHERKYGAVFGYEGEAQHYPEVFERLRETLAPVSPGEVVLVAAGFLGKLYCHWIRARGGIALDLGSIVDHWCGHNTRSLQFRQRYAGPSRQPTVARPDRPAAAPAAVAPARPIPIARDRAALVAWDAVRSGPVGVNLFAEVGKATGIGRAGAGSLAALRAAGVRVHLVDPHDPASGAGSRPPYPLNLFHLNPWLLLDKGLWQAGVLDADTFSHRVNIGYWAWESATTFPEEWRPAFSLLDEIWAPSRFTAEAIGTIAPIPVRVVPHALDLADRPAPASRFGGSGTFRFGFVFDELSGFTRKNPLGLVEAFRRAFPDGGASLALRARTLSDRRRAEIALACDGHPGIDLDVGELPRERLLAWIAACDAYVSLHRAEGFGLTVAEAMALGTPVVATAYSGVSEFLDAATGCPVPFTLTRLAEDIEAYPAGTVWAEPDLDAAAAAMRQLRDAPGEAARRAERARVRIAERFGVEAVGHRIRAELDRITSRAVSRRDPLTSAAAPGAGRTAARHPRVLVLTPVRDAAHALDGYFAALEALDYPAGCLDIHFLEGDSTDDSRQRLLARVPVLERRGHRTRVSYRDFGVRLPGPRWAPEAQRLRRAGIARARNWLLSAALGRAEWVLWIDADVIAYPPDTLTRLLAAERDIVVPHCVLAEGGPTFDLNSFRETRDVRSAGRQVGADGLVQPARGEGRLYLEDFRGRTIVELDSVGGSMLLVRADLHREGLVFPIVPVGGLIETEGFAAMARGAGHRCWGLPDLEIVHAST